MKTRMKKPYKLSKKDIEKVKGGDPGGSVHLEPNPGSQDPGAAFKCASLCTERTGRQLIHPHWIGV